MIIRDNYYILGLHSSESFCIMDFKFKSEQNMGHSLVMKNSTDVQGFSNKYINVIIPIAQWKNIMLKEMVVNILKNTRLSSVTKLKIMKDAKYMSQSEIE